MGVDLRSALPTTLRLCRIVLWVQAAYTVLGGVFALMAATLFAATSAIPFHGGTLSSTGAAMLGWIYVGAGTVLGTLAATLRPSRGWMFVTLVGAELFVAIVDLWRDFDLTASTLFTLAMAVSAVLLVLTATSRRALGLLPAG